MAKKEKTKHYRVLVLTEDFGNNKAGDTLRVETTLATRLIERKVAVLENQKEVQEVIIEKPKKEVKQPKPKNK